MIVTFQYKILTDDARHSDCDRMLTGRAVGLSIVSASSEGSCRDLNVFDAPAPIIPLRVC